MLWFFEGIVDIMLGLMAGDLTFLPAIISAALGFFIIAGILTLIDLYLKTLVVENSRRYWLGNLKRTLSQERTAVKGTYLSAIIATMLVVLISSVIGSLPLIGGIAGIVISWMLLLYLPAVVVAKKGAINGVRESFEIFMANKWDTFVFWLVLGIFTGILTILSFVPLIIAALPVLSAFITGISVGSISQTLLPAIRSNMLALGIGGVITAFLYSYVTLFSVSAKTFYYTQMKKRR
jgi:hypothetical protein